MEIEEPHGSNNDCMKDFCDGYSFKSHPVFRAHPRALQIILFYDDVEPANPLGAKPGHHKLGMHEIIYLVTYSICMYIYVHQGVRHL